MTRGSVIRRPIDLEEFAGCHCSVSSAPARREKCCSQSNGAREFDRDSVLEPTPHWLDLALFVLIAVVLCARPLIPETLERASFSFLPTETFGGATPGVSVVLDFIVLTAAVVVWVRHRRVLSRQRVWIVGFGLLLAAIAVSVIAASDKRAAANAGSQIFAIALAASALARLMSERWMIRLLLAAVIAGGAANAAKCMMQFGWEFDDTIADWQERKPQLIAAGLDANSPTIVNFERRMRSTEAFGYLSHPNTAAACMVMGLLCVVGLLAALGNVRGLDTSRQLANLLVAGALTGALSYGTWLTGSMGAMVAAGAGVVLLVMFRLAHNRLARSARGAFALLLSTYVGVIAIGAGYGLLKGTLPHDSLAFRWEYWRAAGEGYREAALTGLGRENFRPAYLLHKTAESTEEVGNPHNLWVSMLVELGPLGLLAALLLAGGAVYAGLNAGRTPGRQPSPSPSLQERGVHANAKGERAEHAPPPRRLRRRAGAGAVIAGVLIVQALSTGMPFGAPADLLFAMFLLWAVWLAGVWVAAAAVSYSLITQADQPTSGGAWLAAGVLAALCATLVHNLIGFSMLTPAGLAMFAVLAACGVALRGGALRRLTEPGPSNTTLASAATKSKGGTGVSPVVAPRPRNTQARRLCHPCWIAAPLIGAALIAAHLLLVAAPTIRGDAAARRLGQIATASDNAAISAAQRCQRELRRIDSWDPVLPRLLAAAALDRAQAGRAAASTRVMWLDLADSAANDASQRDGASFAVARLRAEILDTRAASGSGNADLKAAAEQWDAAVALYPTDPRSRIGAGLAWARLWDRTKDMGDAGRAVEHLNAALAIDATRDQENASKLGRRELTAIEGALEHLPRR